MKEILREKELIRPSDHPPWGPRNIGTITLHARNVDIPTTVLGG